MYQKQINGKIAEIDQMEVIELLDNAGIDSYDKLHELGNKDGIWQEVNENLKVRFVRTQYSDYWDK